MKEVSINQILTETVRTGAGDTAGWGEEEEAEVETNDYK